MRKRVSLVPVPTVPLRALRIALVLGAAVSLGLAQRVSADQQGTGLRLLSAREGRAIVQKTAWANNEEGRTADCSHLVHDLYEQAGHAYPYASSLDLYRGREPFLRVRLPQPGDLIVWRGHVGIVIDPKQHSFFSSVSSGTRTEYYDSAYWKARGQARFYRYLTSSPATTGGKTMEAARHPPEQEPKAEAESGRGKNRATLEAVKTAPAAADKARGEMGPERAIRANADNSSQIPLRTGGRKPEAADLASALAEANLSASEILRGGDLERLEQPVIVYRDLQVSDVEVKGKHGNAQVKVETLAALSAERMESKQGWEANQLELQRTKKGWVMTPATKNVYVPRDAALRILAARLAMLTQDAETDGDKEHEQTRRGEEAQIIRFMNLLIE